MNLDLIGAFTVGLVGSAHCIGMCGGIASLVAIDPSSSLTTKTKLGNTLGYNLGRLLSYALLGALLGGTLATVVELAQISQLLIGLRVLAALLMILLGLYIGQWWFGVLKLESLGKGIWRYISPIAKKLLPVNHPLKAIPLGFLWGWLPCGLVYSMLSWSIVSGGAVEGAVIMLAFGVGTLPSMLAFGAGATAVNRIKTSRLFRTTAGIVLIGYGIFTAIHALSMFVAH
ncbi:sulfite exporter TauE/SafE family protein [Vibrio astriarenae]|uniref:sulfite exporter TauE/SafE family protein n=1 Tax=Vibrio astriarenae TaxID=1481923 RepID=UPI003735657D